MGMSPIIDAAALIALFTAWSAGTFGLGRLARSMYGARTTAGLGPDGVACLALVIVAVPVASWAEGIVGSGAWLAAGALSAGAYAWCLYESGRQG